MGTQKNHFFSKPATEVKNKFVDAHKLMINRFG
jgi:hypothetical protein